MNRHAPPVIIDLADDDRCAQDGEPLITFPNPGGVEPTVWCATCNDDQPERLSDYPSSWRTFVNEHLHAPTDLAARSTCPLCRAAAKEGTT
jgi:hypothetical protein